MSELTVKIKKLHPDAIVPEYASIGAGCFDLHSIEDGDVGSGWSNRREFKTGLAFEIPIGYVMLIYGRSGLAFHDQIRLSNCVGVIDSDYRGEVSISLTIDNDKCVSLYECDRIAQAMIIPIPKVSFEVVQELSDTERGTGGFGSTGA